jgi:hypothetical protein
MPDQFHRATVLRTSRPNKVHSLVGDGQVPPVLAVTAPGVVDAFGLEEGNVVVRFEAARDARMFCG